MKEKLKNLIEKQDKDFKEIMKNFNGVLFLEEKKVIEVFIAKVRKESIEYEREQILRALPKEKSKYWINKKIKRLNLKTTEQQWALRGICEGHNDCLKQIEEILKEL